MSTIHSYIHKLNLTIVTWSATYITISTVIWYHPFTFNLLLLFIRYHEFCRTFCLGWRAGNRLLSFSLFMWYDLGSVCRPRRILPVSPSGRPLLHASPWLPMVPFPLCDSIHSSSCSILLTYCIGRWMKTEPRFYFIAQYIQNPTTFILYWPSKDHAPPGPYLHPRWVKLNLLS
jgi:hypothetical protein